MPGVDAFVAMAARGEVAAPERPARWLSERLDAWDLPHDEVVDLFGR
jgi:hypothetical protein